MSGKGNLKKLPVKPTTVNSVKKEPHIRMQHVSNEKNGGRLRPKKKKDSLSEQTVTDITSVKDYLSAEKSSPMTKEDMAREDAFYIASDRLLKDIKNAPVDKLGKYADANIPTSRHNLQIADRADNATLEKLSTSKFDEVRSRVAERANETLANKMIYNDETSSSVLESLSGSTDDTGRLKILDIIKKNKDRDDLSPFQYNSTRTSVIRNMEGSDGTKDALRSGEIRRHRDIEFAANRMDKQDLKQLISEGIDGADQFKNSLIKKMSYSEAQKEFPDHSLTKEKGKIKELLSGIKDKKTHKELVDHFGKTLPDNLLDKHMNELDHVFSENAGSFSDYMQDWLDSSSSDGGSVLKQLVANTYGGEVISNHGMSNKDNLKGKADNLPDKIKSNLKRGLVLSKALSRAILDKQHPGVESVKLFRGTNKKELTRPDPDGTQFADSNSISSWTSSEFIAKSFGRDSADMRGGIGVVMQASVPKDDILGVNQFWSFGGKESEHIVMSEGEREVKVQELP